jgi:ribosomal protein S18 acetylase RimI-like enzyme
LDIPQSAIRNPHWSEAFTVSLRVVIRACREDDLPSLEWYGLFTEHREIIRSTFESQQRGEAVMLVAEAGGFPLGQVWINLALKGAEGTGALWAVRVLPGLRNLGIGSRLVAAAEDLLREWGYARVELGVERDNPGARRFYERHGYRVVDTVQGEYAYATPEGVPAQMRIDEWILLKEL